MDQNNCYSNLCNRIGLGLLAYTGASLAASALLGAILYIVAPALSENITAMLVVSNLCTYLIAPAVMLAVIWQLPMVELRQRSLTPKRFGKLSAEGLAIMFGLSMVTNGLIALLGFITGKDTANLLNSTVGELTPGLAFLFLVVIAPVFEEIIFRHLLLRRLLPLGQMGAVVVSAVAFGLFHNNLYQFFYATALGLFFGVVTVKTGQIRWTILLHALMNLFGGVIPLMIEGGPNWLYGVWGVILYTILIAGIVLLVRDWKNLLPRRDTTKAGWKCILTSPGMLIYAAVTLIFSVMVVFIGGSVV